MTFRIFYELLKRVFKNKSNSRPSVCLQFGRSSNKIFECRTSVVATEKEVESVQM